MSLAKAKIFLRDIGMTIRFRDGEYQVNFADAKDDRATYYTNDIEDAVGTAIHMAYNRDQPAKKGVPNFQTRLIALQFFSNKICSHKKGVSK